MPPTRMITPGHSMTASPSRTGSHFSGHTHPDKALHAAGEQVQNHKPSSLNNLCKSVLICVICVPFSFIRVLFPPEMVKFTQRRQTGLADRNSRSHGCSPQTGCNRAPPRLRAAHCWCSAPSTPSYGSMASPAISFCLTPTGEFLGAVYGNANIFIRIP